MCRCVTEHSETAFDDRELNSAVKVRTFAFGRLFLYLCNNANNVFFPMYGATFENQCALLLSLSVICSAKKNKSTAEWASFFFIAATHIVASAAPPSNAHRLQMWHHLKEKQIAFPQVFDLIATKHTYNTEIINITQMSLLLVFKLKTSFWLGRLSLTIPLT